MELLQAIEQIVAKKRVEHRRPLHALAIEVAALTGIPVVEQLKEVHQLERQGIVVVGKTFNGVYYRLVEEFV